MTAKAASWPAAPTSCGRSTKDGLRPDLIVDVSGMDELRGVAAEDGLAPRRRAHDLQRSCRRTRACGGMRAASPTRPRRSARFRSATRPPSAATSPTRRPAATASQRCWRSRPGPRSWDAGGSTELRPLADVVIGAGRDLARPGQAIAAFVFPVLDERWITAFAKVGSRSAVTVARLSAAVAVAQIPPERGARRRPRGPRRRRRDGLPRPPGRVGDRRRPPGRGPASSSRRRARRRSAGPSRAGTPWPTSPGPRSGWRTTYGADWAFASPAEPAWRR